jgi:transcriptional regulator with XRE-family HTH domain
MEHAAQPEPIGAKIRRLRQELGLPQDRLALKARVDQSGLSKFERGREGHRLGHEPLTRIAAALGMSLSDLVAGTDYTS